MSRIQKLKNRKSDIKATISGLTLALAIGVTGCLGSYAYFSDLADIRNDLVVTMGNLDTSIGEGFKHTLEKSNFIEKEFEIKNNGSLEQLVTINFDEIYVNNAETSELKYTLTLYEVADILYDGTIVLDDGATILDTTLDELENQEVKIDKVLPPTESFYLKSTVTKLNEPQVEGGNINFDLVVTGEQTDANNSSKGGTK
ncbi:MAG: TasA family protein [Romboutsia sp.]